MRKRFLAILFCLILMSGVAGAQQQTLTVPLEQSWATRSAGSQRDDGLHLGGGL